MEFRDYNRGMPDTLRTYASASDTLGSPFLDASGRGVEKWIAPSTSIGTRKYVLHASVSFALMPWLFLALGARGEGFEYSEDWFLMPRASLGWALTDDVELTSVVGLQTQTQNFLDYSARSENRDLESERARVASVELDWCVKKFGTRVGLNLYVRGCP